MEEKQFSVTTYDDKIEIRTNHPLWNRIRMAWGLIRYGSFRIVAPTKVVYDHS